MLNISTHAINKRIAELFKRRSLKFWILLGMLTAIAPLLLSSIGGYYILRTGIIDRFSDVSYRQRYDILPVQRLRIALWETMPLVQEHIKLNNNGALNAYRAAHAHIEDQFAAVSFQSGDNARTGALLKKAKAHWLLADRRAAKLFSGATRQENSVAHLGAVEEKAYRTEIQSASDALAAISDQLVLTAEQDHDLAIRSYKASEWLFAVAAFVSLGSVALGLYFVGRVLSTSIERLVKGAERFAEGDRGHRIQITIPPELHLVAQAFNTMIVRIQESETALASLALEDSLTQLGNRRAFDEAFNEMKARFARNGEVSALLALDIDHFKRINDRLGHAAGDQVLAITAKAIVSNLRPLDRVFRVGGEEFLAILPGTDVSNAADVAERLRDAIASTSFLFDGHTINVSVSIGVATMAQTSEQNELVAAADAALYQAKNQGRNMVIVSDLDSVTPLSAR